MKNKFVRQLVLTAAFSTIFSMTAMAGQWIPEGQQWRYRNDDGSYAVNRWEGDYYLGSDGIMVTSTRTPDGYYVDANGKWDGRPSDLVQEPVNAIGQAIFQSPIVDDEINWNEKTYSYNGRSVQIIDSRDKEIYDRGTYYEIPNAVVKSCKLNEYDEYDYEPIAQGPVYVRKNATVNVYDMITGAVSVKTAEQIYQQYGALYEERYIALRTIGCATRFDANGYITELSVHAFE